MGEYRLLRRLGAGGMGQVFLGRTTGGRTVAVKTVHPHFAADPEFRLRFRQEVAAARRVGGRWTAPVLDADTDGEQPWVATGYVAGPALGAAVREFGPLPAATVRSLGIGLAEALAAVHGLGLVHRDVKPSNVLLALDGPRLIDFGISRALDAATSLTRSGYVVGSPGYLSPEQAEGQSAGPASDVFSLGAVLAYAATGVAPYGAGVSTPVLLYRVLHEEPDLGGLDDGLRALVTACLAKDPAQRPTPERIREQLAADDPAAAGRLTERDWLPAGIAGSLARLAVELLDLDTEASAVPPTTTGPFANEAPTDGKAVPPAPGHQPTVTATPTPHAPPQPQPLPLPPPDPQPTGASAVTTAPAPLRPGTLRVTLVAAVVLAAVVAGASVYLSTDHSTNANKGKPANHNRTTAATDPASATPEQDSASASPIPQTLGGTVPATFIGTWQGRLSNQQSTVDADFTITVTQGQKGEAVGSIHNNTGAGTRFCDSLANLVSAGTDRMILKTRPMSVLTGCVADPHEQVYSRNADGSLHLTVGGYSGDLARK
ncbi:serine/threonine-protein kinase [Kitasatospora paracochleata]|uniref:Serine/threonine protein kinase n=2 Tax=Kitasatospora paracochleata TaxID=58354 RepID=A0ABT1IV22_9ACTN|nr:serine/threonine-protein kinase [Kitasatospora paracochleata]MCP2308990.1 serine/threonine protein kinase [Kitasatospora paracochleata]